MKSNTRPAAKGFTLTELLIVILIIVVLAALGFTGVRRLIENARKTQAMAQFRDLKVGLTMLEGDYGRPPIPSNKRSEGWDTIYGDPGGYYENGYIVATLSGEDQDFDYPSGVTFAVRESNPRMETYLTFALATGGKSGVGEDGNLYDPWGHQVIIAVNAFGDQNPETDLLDFNYTSPGMNDRALHTWGLAEYNETKPRDESFACWSYGKDGKKGDGIDIPTQVTSLKKSDDVVSW